MQASTENRYALALVVAGVNFTFMYSTHRHLMMMVNYYASAPSVRILHVETLESAIRADALARGVW
jgi:hypothetical protein